MVLCWGLELGALAAMGGAAVGYFVPGHSRSALPFAGRQLGAEQTGAGLKSPPGLGAAMVVLVAALALFVWRVRQPPATKTTAKPARERRWPFLTILVAGVLPTVFCSFFGLISGALIRNQQNYGGKVQRIQAILETGEFPDVTLTRFSWMQLDLQGTVPSHRARISLRNKLNAAVGAVETEDVMRCVRIVP
jgi:hypothetical protein